MDRRGRFRVVAPHREQLDLHLPSQRGRWAQAVLQCGAARKRAAPFQELETDLPLWLAPDSDAAASTTVKPRHGVGGDSSGSASAEAIPYTKPVIGANARTAHASSADAKIGADAGVDASVRIIAEANTGARTEADASPYTNAHTEIIPSIDTSEDTCANTIATTSIVYESIGKIKPITGTDG